MIKIRVRARTKTTKKEKNMASKVKEKTRVVLTRKKYGQVKRQEIDTRKLINSLVGGKVFKRTEDKEKALDLTYNESTYQKPLSTKQWNELDNFMKAYIKNQKRYVELSDLVDNVKYQVVDFVFCGTCKEKLTFKNKYFLKQCHKCKGFQILVGSFVKARYFVNPYESYLYNEKTASIARQVESNNGMRNNGFSTSMKGQAIR
jgi:uncharacterized CHY-type Zn-finger protein